MTNRQNLETLDAIGVRHKTDQSSLFHGYLDILEPYFEPFRFQPIVFVEIGVAGGASLRTWNDYFARGARVIGIDHNPAVVNPCPPDTTVIIGDATDPNVWKELMTKNERPTIVQDDGGHFSNMIIPAFNHAWPLLLPGGIYICQDLHQIWQQEYAHQAEYTAFEFFVEKMHEMNERGEGQCARPVASDIKAIHFYKSLVIVEKR